MLILCNIFWGEVMCMYVYLLNKFLLMTGIIKRSHKNTTHFFPLFLKDFLKKYLKVCENSKLV